MIKTNSSAETPLLCIAWRVFAVPNHFFHNFFIAAPSLATLAVHCAIGQTEGCCEIAKLQKTRKITYIRVFPSANRIDKLASIVD